MPRQKLDMTLRTNRQFVLRLLLKNLGQMMHIFFVFHT